MSVAFAPLRVRSCGLITELDQEAMEIRFKVVDEENRVSPWSDWYSLKEGGSITVNTQDLWTKGRWGRG